MKRCGILVEDEVKNRRARWGKKMFTRKEHKTLRSRDFMYRSLDREFGGKGTRDSRQP